MGIPQEMLYEFLDDNIDDARKLAVFFSEHPQVTDEILRKCVAKALQKLDKVHDAEHLEVWFTEIVKNEAIGYARKLLKR